MVFQCGWVWILQSYAEGARQAIPAAAEQGPLVGSLRLACCRKHVEGKQLMRIGCQRHACTYQLLGN